jgi:hypothetical protein
MVQVVEHLLSKYKALSTTKKWWGTGEEPTLSHCPAFCGLTQNHPIAAWWEG